MQNENSFIVALVRRNSYDYEFHPLSQSDRVLSRYFNDLDADAISFACSLESYLDDASDYKVVILYRSNGVLKHILVNEYEAF